MKIPTILECTLRDGSYSINFKFTKHDTKNIICALESVGFEWIEIGHGVGLGASEKGPYVAAETDEAYMNCAAEHLKHAKWGMFCIPGIATLDHLRLANDYAMKFIRIGTNIEQAEQILPFIALAKKFGFFVCVNFMKSYAKTPHEFTQAALMAQSHGADLIYLVDSAGCMLPEQVKGYISQLKDASPNIKIGFHGHNNLGLAVANSLMAMEMGVEIIDTTLQGIGRSAGNTPTEQFICCLLAKGLKPAFDPIAVMDVGEQYITPLWKQQNVSSLDLVCGLAQFHSSYMNTIEHYSEIYRVDPRKLILLLCQHTKENAPKELVESLAQELQEKGIEGCWKPHFNHYFGNEQSLAASKSQSKHPLPSEQEVKCNV